MVKSEIRSRAEKLMQWAVFDIRSWLEEAFGNWLLVVGKMTPKTLGKEV